jgi:CrcB protein
MKIILVFLGGGMGAVARYWMQGAVHDVAGASFPYGTLSVNVLGAFVIGFLMTVFEARFLVQPALRVFLTIGILGGFTTFSAFSFETFRLFQEGSISAGLLNAFVSVTGCLAATWFGTIAGKLL